MFEVKDQYIGSNLAPVSGSAGLPCRSAPVVQ